MKQHNAPEKPEVVNSGAVGIWPPLPANERLNAYDRNRRDMLAGHIITGYMASYANPNLDLSRHGFPTPTFLANSVVQYVDALIAELDK